MGKCGTFARIYKRTRKLFERAITLRIHKNEEKNKYERSSTSRVSFSFFLHARARTRNEARARAKRGARSILVFPKVASSKFKFRGRPRRRREIRMAREAVMRRVAKVNRCLLSLFLFARSIEKESLLLLDAGVEKIFASNLPFRMSFQLPFVVVVVFPLDFSLAARLKKKKR